MHPEWAYRTINGEIVDYNGDIHVCLNGDYQQIYALKILEELLARFPFDAVFCNQTGFKVSDYSYNYYGICHCESCKRRFRDMSGMDLPRSESFSDPAYGRYLKFKKICVEEYIKKYHETVYHIRPDIAVSGVEFLRLEVNTEFRKRPLPHWQYGPAYLVKSYRGVDAGERIIAASTVDFIGYYYRHIAVTPELQELRLWQALAHLGGIDWYLMGRLDNHLDRSGHAGIKKVFAFASDHADDFAGYSPESSVLLIVDNPVGEAEERGWARVLLENYVQFDMARPDQLLTKGIFKYSVIILPDMKYLTDDQLTAIDKFANDGGIVVATGETALYNELCEARSAFGHQCLGVEKIRGMRDDMVSSMLLLDDEDKKSLKVSRTQIYPISVINLFSPL